MPIHGFYTLISCQKEGHVKQVYKTEASSKGLNSKYHDSLIYRSNITIPVEVAYKDLQGQVFSIKDKNFSGKKNMAMDDCDPSDFHTIELIYRGFFLGNVCLGTFGHDETELWVAWDLHLPASINLVADPLAVSRVRIGTAGFQSVPTGTGFRDLDLSFYVIESYTHPTEGIPMKKWRILSDYTNFNLLDYCTNITFETSIMLKTDCFLIPYLLPNPALISHSIVPPFYRVPYFLVQNATIGSTRQIEVMQNDPLCDINGCQGPSKGYSNYYIFEYRKQGDPGWMERLIDDYSNAYIVLPSAGTYEYRSKGVLQFLPDTLWTEYTDIDDIFIP